MSKEEGLYRRPRESEESTKGRESIPSKIRINEEFMEEIGKTIQDTERYLLKEQIQNWLTEKKRKEGEEFIGVVLYKDPLLLADVTICSEGFRSALKEKKPEVEPQVVYVSYKSPFTVLIPVISEIVIGIISGLIATAIIAGLKKWREKQSQKQEEKLSPIINNAKIVVFTVKVAKGGAEITYIKEAKYG